jgi:hypothetical protein
MRLFVWFEWIAFAASVVILLRVANVVGFILYALGPGPFAPCTIAHGNSAKNGRGDLVEYQIKDCAIIGSLAEDRIGLTLADTEDFIALVYFGQGPNWHEPGLRWLDDDHVSVDLGNVTGITPQIRHLGRVTISYTYSGAEPRLE